MHTARFDPTEVEGWLERLYVAAEGAHLRTEDRRKAVEVAAMLDEVRMACGRLGRRRPMTIVDAAAGKAYVGVLAAKLVLERETWSGRVVCLEREPDRVASSRAATVAAGCDQLVTCLQADVASAEAWPDGADLVVALHACGPASDAVIDRTVASRARSLLLVPCCTSRGVAAVALAETAGGVMGIPRHAPVRRRFIQAMVDAERTLRLEAAGWQTEVVEFVAPTVTPHNLLWRSRRVAEAGRMLAATRALARLHASGTLSPEPSAGAGVSPPIER